MNTLTTLEIQTITTTKELFARVEEFCKANMLVFNNRSTLGQLSDSAYAVGNISAASVLASARTRLWQI